MDASIVIRTYNEARWLGDTLSAVAEQQGGLRFETLVVDSGSTDGTLEIAHRHGCRIEHIAKEEFTFGRSLNRGCEAAAGRVLVFLSGHCIPVGNDWLSRLVAPLLEERCVYVYGRQHGREGVTKFSEEMLFRKYFPPESKIPQEGFFCNNANAALLAECWRKNRFDEEITGLEDLLLAKNLIAHGLRIGYVADAPVVHLHDETWQQVRLRYEREAIALQKIMPEVRVGFGDFLRYAVMGAGLDLTEALEEPGVRRKNIAALAFEIALFRFYQYWGTYRGANEHRRLSLARKEQYYYPR